jgi:hypothetical protein
MPTPTSYKTLAGLLKAAERVLSDNHNGTRTRFDGMSHSMWLHNAEYVARKTFGDDSSVQEMRRKWSISRAQDLRGGQAVFGVPLPTRDFIVGDNVPGVGEVEDVVNDQLQVAGEWFHKSCFEKVARV